MMPSSHGPSVSQTNNEVRSVSHALSHELELKIITLSTQLGEQQQAYAQIAKDKDHIAKDKDHLCAALDVTKKEYDATSLIRTAYEDELRKLVLLNIGGTEQDLDNMRSSLYAFYNCEENAHVFKEKIVKEKQEQLDKAVKQAAKTFEAAKEARVARIATIEKQREVDDLTKELALVQAKLRSFEEETRELRTAVRTLESECHDYENKASQLATVKTDFVRATRAMKRVMLTNYCRKFVLAKRLISTHATLLVILEALANDQEEDHETEMGEQSEIGTWLEVSRRLKAKNSKLRTVGIDLLQLSRHFTDLESVISTAQTQMLAHHRKWKRQASSTFEKFAQINRLAPPVVEVSKEKLEISRLQSTLKEAHAQVQELLARRRRAVLPHTEEVAKRDPKHDGLRVKIKNQQMTIAILREELDRLRRMSAGPPIHFRRPASAQPTNARGGVRESAWGAPYPPSVASPYPLPNSVPSPYPPSNTRDPDEDASMSMSMSADYNDQCFDEQIYSSSWEPPEDPRVEMMREKLDSLRASITSHTRPGSAQTRPPTRPASAHTRPGSAMNMNIRERGFKAPTTRC